MNRRTSILARLDRERLAEIVIFLGAFLLALAIAYGLAVRAEGAPLSASERAAIEKIESNGDPAAHKKDEDARGAIQIRAIYVADANRILGEERFTHDDAFDQAKAWEMFEIVTSYYIRAYGYADTFEVRCRIHNGGGKGPTRRSTLEYWRKVKEAKR